MKSVYVAILAAYLGTIGGSTARAQHPTNDPNTFYGTGAGSGLSDQANSAFGFDALAGDGFGGGNTAIGDRALNANFDGSGNTATGAGTRRGGSMGSRELRSSSIASPDRRAIYWR